MQPTRLRTGAATDRGRQRTSNEDAYLCLPEAGIFAVIDGVGGYAGGEVAAAEAREAIRRRLEHRTGTPEVRLREAVANANNTIYWRSQEESELAGMACVLTVVLLEEHRLFAAHVGDTRLYKMHHRQIRKLTRDHSFVGVLEDREELGEYEAMRHPRRNEILRDVGSELHEPDDDNFIDIVEAPFEPDAALLLCTDGLTDLAPSRVLLRLASEHAGDPQATVDALIHVANEAGGTDNVTVVVVEGPAFGQAASAEPQPSPQAADTGHTVAGDAGARAAPSQNEAPATSGYDQPTPARGTERRRSPWRYYWYGAATVLAVLTTAYAAWILWLNEPVTRFPEITSRLTAAEDSTSAGTIDRLLERARPGDTVSIPPGVYPGTVRLRNGVTLRSTEPGGARIVPPATPGDTVAVRAEHVTRAALIGFYIGPDTTGEAAARDSFAVGILVRNAAVRIANATVTGTTRAGIEVETAAASPHEVVLQNCEISHNAGAGVVARGENGQLRITDNRILSNGKAGIVLVPNTAPDVRANTITGNGSAGIEIRLQPDSTRARLRRANSFTLEGVASQGEDVRVVIRNEH